MPSRYARLLARQAALQAAGLDRRLRPLQMTTPTTGVLSGRQVVVFCSNDYLGLAHHPAVRAAWQGAAAGSARLISGDRPAHHALEQALSELYGRPATLLSSGYHANLALLTTLLQRGDVVASDALNHASIIDGVRLSRAEKVILPHGQPAAIPSEATLTIIEGLYSMDGDRPAIAPYLGRHWLAVDEAHAFGAIGPGGRGVAAAQGVTPDFVIGTLGKAIGAYGAFIIGPPVLRDLLLSSGRTFIFTTGLPEPAAAAGLEGLRRARQEGLREALAQNTARLRRALAQVGMAALGADHIVPVVCGSRTMEIAAKLLDAGYYVPGIRPPTVAPGTERIRITVSAAHTAAQLDGLVDALVQAAA